MQCSRGAQLEAWSLGGALGDDGGLTHGLTSSKLPRGPVLACRDQEVAPRPPRTFSSGSSSYFPVPFGGFNARSCPFLQPWTWRLTSITLQAAVALAISVSTPKTPTMRVIKGTSRRLSPPLSRSQAPA